MSRKNFVDNAIKHRDVVTTNTLIYTEHDELWAFVEQYLILLGHTGIKEDLKFMRLFCKLTDYVQSKLKLPKNGGAITDMYHVACQERVETDDR